MILSHLTQDRKPLAQAAAVLEVESMLQEADYLAPVWASTQLQSVWRRSLARPNVNARDVALHCHALQRFCKPPRTATHPSRYHFMCVWWGWSCVYVRVCLCCILHVCFHHDTRLGAG